MKGGMPLNVIIYFWENLSSYSVHEGVLSIAVISLYVSDVW
jgi:hypothetical protein